MAEERKQLYLKLGEDFFDSGVILYLESLKKGSEYINILLKLYIKSLRTNGQFMVTDTIPYSPEMIACMVRKPLKLVVEALEVFKMLGLVTTLESGAICMDGFIDSMGCSSTDADRKRSERARKKEEKMTAKETAAAEKEDVPEAESVGSAGTGNATDAVSDANGQDDSGMNCQEERFPYVPSTDTEKKTGEDPVEEIEELDEIDETFDSEDMYAEAEDAFATSAADETEEMTAADGDADGDTDGDADGDTVADTVADTGADADNHVESNVENCADDSEKNNIMDDGRIAKVEDSVHDVSTVCPESIPEVSAVCPESVHEVSTVCPENVPEVSGQNPEDVCHVTEGISFFEEPFPVKNEPLADTEAVNKAVDKAVNETNEVDEPAQMSLMELGIQTECMTEEPVETAADTAETEAASAEKGAAAPNNPNKTKGESISYQLVADMYNMTCKSLPRMVKLSESRKKAIRARLKGGYTMDDFKKAFQMAEESLFMRGKNDRNWHADFDWIMKDANMAKVLEGKYANEHFSWLRNDPEAKKMKETVEKEEETVPGYYKYLTGYAPQEDDPFA